MQELHWEPSVKTRTSTDWFLFADISYRSIGYASVRIRFRFFLPVSSSFCAFLMYRVVLVPSLMDQAMLGNAERRVIFARCKHGTDMRNRAPYWLRSYTVLLWSGACRARQ